MGKLIIQTIPFKSFKEKVNLIKEYQKLKYSIQIEDNYIIVW